MQADPDVVPLRVFLAGGTGFIGGHLLRKLQARGHTITCLVRPGTRSLSTRPNLHVVEGDWTRPETWLEHIAGHDVVVNTVGIIRERRGSSFATVHTTSPIALFNSAASAHVGKIVQLSALGVDDGAVSQFHRSKRAADTYLARSGRPFVILRPSFVYGPGDHSMSFFTRLARLPLTPVPGDGQYEVQPIHVDDLTRALVKAIETPHVRDVIIDAGGGTILTFDRLLDTLARRHGKPAGTRKLHIPWAVMRLTATATDILRGHGPITRDELGMLRRGNRADNRSFIEHFGFAPRSFEG